MTIYQYFFKFDLFIRLTYVYDLYNMIIFKKVTLELSYLKMTQQKMI